MKSKVRIAFVSTVTIGLTLYGLVFIIKPYQETTLSPARVDELGKSRPVNLIIVEYGEVFHVMCMNKLQAACTVFVTGLFRVTDLSALDISESTLSSVVSLKPPATKSIVLLAYQRSGSTLLGSLFNLDPRVFYVFEPLDALFSALYGTEPGWNIPSNIVTYNNGTERPMSDSDKTAVSNFLIDLMTCDIASLPTEFLVHVYWQNWLPDTGSSHDYGRCLVRGKQISHTYDRSVHGYCGRRYGGQPPDRQLLCNRLLNDAVYRRSHDDRLISELFSAYRYRMDNHVRRRVEETCGPLFSSTCRSTPMRVVKLVRASMESMRALLGSLPDSYVVHLVRDPRAVARSRISYDASARAAFSDAAANDSERMEREASIYCRQVVEDVRWRRRLEREFPGRLYSLTYEQLIGNPNGFAVDIYRFIGESPASSSITEFTRSTTVNKLITGMKRSTRFVEEFEMSDQYCTDMLQLYPQYSANQR